MPATLIDPDPDLGEMPTDSGAGEADEFWSNPFHHAALTAGFVAAAEGWLSDSARVRRLAYALYEGELARSHRPIGASAKESSVAAELAD